MRKESEVEEKKRERERERERKAEIKLLSDFARNRILRRRLQPREKVDTFFERSKDFS